MKKLINKLKSGAQRAKLDVRHFMSDERGDTNFISIAIILVIVIGIAIAFIFLKDRIMGWTTGKVNELGSVLGFAQEEPDVGDGLFINLPRWM